MKWEQVLGGHFYRLTFQNEMTTEKGDKITFNAIGFYKLSEGSSFMGT